MLNVDYCLISESAVLSAGAGPHLCPSLQHASLFSFTVITYDIVYCDFVTSIMVLEGCSAEICIQTFSELPSDQAVTFVPSAGNYSISGMHVVAVSV